MKYLVLSLAVFLSACGTTTAGIVAEKPEPTHVVYVVVTATPQATAIPTEKPFRHVAHYVDFPDSPMGAEVVDGVIVGNGVPDWMEVCTEAGIYGNPYGLNEPLGTVKAGEIVRVHDMSQDNTWVMVKSARWIPTGALCWNYKENLQ